MAYRRRVKASSVVMDAFRNAKFTDATVTVKQNPANSYQQWLIPGVLCTAKKYILLHTSRLCVESIPVTWSSNVYCATYDLPHLAVMKGENIIYLGELYRRRIKDNWALGGVRVDVAHKFLAPRCGVIVADPTFFQDAFTEDVLKT